MHSLLSRGSRAFAALAATALLVVGCASSPASAPDADRTPSGGASAEANPIRHSHAQFEADDLDAAWLDDGRMIGIVTWGSSTPTCRPAEAEATAEGQALTVRLTDQAEASEGCNADLTPQGTMLMTPEGIDVTQDVELNIVHGSQSGTVTLPALAAAPQEPADQGVSAGWFGTDGILLLTWGSSSCTPNVSDVELTDAGATATFETTTGMCTMDYAPRLTPILLPEPVDSDADFTLTLVGQNLDGTVAVLG